MEQAALETKDLILRPFNEGDLDDILAIYSDPISNPYLPWDVMQTKEQAEEKLKSFTRLVDGKPAVRVYAICEKESNHPIGWIEMELERGYEVGYGLRHEYWHHGYASQALEAVIEEAKRLDLPYLYATHDRENRFSGAVMKKAGMSYRYSYEEDWKPKNKLVTFRLYQIDLKPDASTYDHFWTVSDVHYVEEEL